MFFIRLVASSAAAHIFSKFFFACEVPFSAASGFPRQPLALGVRMAEQTQERVDELKSGEPFGKRIELRRISEQSEQLFRLVRRQAQNTESIPRVGRTKPVIRFISVVLPDPLGPTRLVIPGGIDSVTRFTPSTSP